MPQPTPEIIRSAQNAWFRRFREAARVHEREIVLEGPRAVRDAVALGWRPLATALLPDAVSPATGVPELRFAPALFRELTDTHHPQGVLALFERPAGALDALFARESPLIVVLDGVQDPGNVGTIVRIAAAFDASGVALTEGSADPLAPKALRASAGAALAVPLVQTTRRALLAELQTRRIPLWAAIAGAGDEARPPLPAAVVFGSEGRGVSEEILAVAEPVSIAISSRVESLNVSAAAAILLHEMYGRLK